MIKIIKEGLGGSDYGSYFSDIIVTSLQDSFNKILNSKDIGVRYRTDTSNYVEMSAVSAKVNREFAYLHISFDSYNFSLVLQELLVFNFESRKLEEYRVDRSRWNSIDEMAKDISDILIKINKNIKSKENI